MHNAFQPDLPWAVSICFELCLKIVLWAKEIAHQLRAFAAHTEDTGLVSDNHMVDLDVWTCSCREVTTSLFLSLEAPSLQTVYTHAYRQTGKHAKMNKYILKRIIFPPPSLLPLSSTSSTPSTPQRGQELPWKINKICPITSVRQAQGLPPPA